MSRKTQLLLTPRWLPSAQPSGFLCGPGDDSPLPGGNTAKRQRRTMSHSKMCSQNPRWFAFYWEPSSPLLCLQSYNLPHTWQLQHLLPITWDSTLCLHLMCHTHSLWIKLQPERQRFELRKGFLAHEIRNTWEGIILWFQLLKKQHSASKNT